MEAKFDLKVAENDTGDNRTTGEMPLQEKFIPSDGFFAVSRGVPSSVERQG